MVGGEPLHRKTPDRPWQGEAGTVRVMARSRKPKREKQPLPPPLAPEDRTVGQLVAETIRLYGRNFWPSLALGILPALTVVAGMVSRGRPIVGVISGAGVVVWSLSYVAACVIVSGDRPSATILLRALLVGIAVYLFVPFLAVAAILPAVAWLGLMGLAVPAAVIEDLGFREALRRGYRLGRVDLVHAIGSVAALAITVFVTIWVMFVLLRAGSDQGIYVAAGLAMLVLSPVLFLGGALLYYDQAARLRVRSIVRPERSRNAALPDARDADRPGAADTAVEPGSAARSQP
jgi:hypothetical protein